MVVSWLLPENGVALADLPIATFADGAAMLADASVWLQIGLFAVPFVTVVGWILGHPFSLGFDPFAALVLLLSVMHSAHMINDAESHW